ncbi:MAG: hypothetical protein U9Q34_06675 [Elusimicrobiota bacterium]|nr:hypothetical protein [Elusimicrobiota bacterium]
MKRKNKSKPKSKLQTKRKYSFDDYIEFASQMNEFMGHPRKPFEPIKGKHFKL